MRSFGLGLVFIATMAFVACGGDTPPSISVTASPTSFTSGSTVTFTITVTDFELRMPPDVSGSGGHGSGHKGLTAANEGHGDDADGETYFTNAGHFHVYLDTTDTNPLRQAWHPEIQLPIRASAGSHQLIFRLNDDSHRFFVPHITSRVDVTVQ